MEDKAYRPIIDMEDEVGPINDSNRKYLLELFNQAWEVKHPDKTIGVPVIFGTGGELK